MNQAPTPQYVLLEDGKPITAQMASPWKGADPTMIYAFSDKGPYDRFCATTDRTLCPYPLVKGFLRRQILEHSSSIHYLVIDALSPNEDRLNVAPMSAVLESLEMKISEVSTIECDVAQLIPPASIITLEENRGLAPFG